MIISSKADFFARSQRLEFGNRLRQFSFDEYLMLKGNQLPKRVSVRNCIAGGDKRVQRYRLTPVQATNHCLKLLRSHIVDREALLLDESAPDHLVQLQAEVRNSERGLDLRYALGSGVGMRQAFDQMKHAFGTRAFNILRTYTDAESQDWIFHILQQYQHSVIELSSYSITLGVLGWDTVVWEVRDY